MYNIPAAHQNYYHEYASLEPVTSKKINFSGFLNNGALELDIPVIRQARNSEDLEGNFSLVYKIYREKGFVTIPKPHGMFFSIYSLLPDTTHVSVKNNLETISNLTKVTDTKEFGLPMDVIYRKELDKIRHQGRKIAELSSLATPGKYRWHNIFLYQIQAVYWYALYQGIDDICIVVNPRHKKYYTTLFPFEQIGPVRHYPRVNAPAVGLRARVYEGIGCMIKFSNFLNSGTHLYKHLCLVDGRVALNHYDSKSCNGDYELVLQPNSLNCDSVRHFIDLEPELIKEMNPVQKKTLEKAYLGLFLN